MELENLLTQRTKEMEEATRMYDTLKGNIQAITKQVKERVEKIDKRIIEFYSIYVPKLDGTDSVEDLIIFKERIEEVENLMGAISVEYLKTGNVEVLKQLPSLPETVENKNNNDDPYSYLFK